MSLAVTGLAGWTCCFIDRSVNFHFPVLFNLDETDITCTGVQFHTSLPMQGEKLLEFNPCTD